MVDSSDTSKTQEEYLPQYILDILANRVALKLSYFGSKFNHKTMWYPVLKACLQIEKNPLSIDSVILEAKKENDPIATNPTFTLRMFHTFYARIYILLYYKYGTDPIYKDCVFPELINNMSIYASEKSMELIHKGVEKIHQFEKSYEKTDENRKEKPEQNDCQNQIGFLKKQIEGLKSENEQLKKESAEKDKEIVRRDETINSLKQELAELKSNGCYSETDVSELKEELEIYKGKKTGLNVRQTAIVGYKLADAFGILPNDKQKLAPLLSKITGYGKRSLAQKICGYFSEEEEKELAEIFSDYPKIAKIIYNKYHGTPLP